LSHIHLSDGLEENSSDPEIPELPKAFSSPQYIDSELHLEAAPVEIEEVKVEEEKVTEFVYEYGQTKQVRSLLNNSFFKLDKPDILKATPKPLDLEREVPTEM